MKSGDADGTIPPQYIATLHGDTDQRPRCRRQLALKLRPGSRHSATDLSERMLMGGECQTSANVFPHAGWIRHTVLLSCRPADPSATIRQRWNTDCIGD